jgi:hypothetical protein
MPRGFIPVPGVFKVQLVYSYQGQRIENVLNVLSGGSLLVADADRIETVFQSWWNVTGKLQSSTACSLVLVVLDAINVESGLHKEYTAGLPIAGSKSSQGMPGNVTTSVKLSTGLRGRSFRGRMYWPGLTALAITGGTLNGSDQTAIQAAVNTLRTNLVGDAAGDKLVVVSYRHAGVWRASGVATEVTAASVHANLDSQRRRLPGRGL